MCVSHWAYWAIVPLLSYCKIYSKIMVAKHFGCLKKLKSNDNIAIATILLLVPHRY